MPRIDAPSVREHRDHRAAALVAAAEDLLREGQALTAGAVAGRSGIARNSIYRYVDSVDDLVELVLARHIPAWSQSVTEAVDAAATPRDGVLAYVRASLAQVAEGDHGWLIALAGRGLSASGRQRVRAAHSDLAEVLASQVRLLAPANPALVVAVVQGIVDAAARRIDAGDDAAEVSAYTAQVVERAIG